MHVACSLSSDLGSAALHIEVSVWCHSVRLQRRVLAVEVGSLGFVGPLAPPEVFL